jgi:Tfp pilus assembly PilM family ATPase
VVNKKKIAQVIMIGGGANMPGLSQYLTKELSLPARMLEPWDRIDFGNLTPPNDIQRSMYVTVAGEAILEPKEIFA